MKSALIHSAGVGAVHRGWKTRTSQMFFTGHHGWLQPDIGDDGAPLTRAGKGFREP